jgi:uncharacterized phage protein (TIGR01671 family)
MREIKFRSYSELHKTMSLNTEYSYYYKFQVGKIIYNENYTDCILMQYTGLKAKGVEIYEGDIVRVEYGIGKVVFYCAMFMIEWLDDKEANMESLAFSNAGYKQGIIREDLEVIGNIYQNPELLNK